MEKQTQKKCSYYLLVWLSFKTYLLYYDVYHRLQLHKFPFSQVTDHTSVVCDIQAVSVKMLTTGIP